jgi:RNA polymerase sigma-70 factor (ECF subfamily)
MTAVTTDLGDSLAAALSLAAAGDELAFAGIVRAHHDDMVRGCFVVCGDLDIADEAAQAAWTIAWRKLDVLRDPDRLRSWLVSIAANEARQLIRRRRRPSVMELAVAPPDRTTRDPAQRVEDLDLVNALARLARLLSAARARRRLSRRDSKSRWSVIAKLRSEAVQGPASGRGRCRSSLIASMARWSCSMMARCSCWAARALPR